MNSEQFLQDASPDQILDAAALNHRCLFGQDGEGASPAGNYNWTPRPQCGRETALVFPRYDPSTLSADLDRYMDGCRRQGIKVVSAWTLEKDFVFLGSALMARGFGPGGSFQIMALDLARMNEDFPATEGLRTEIITDEAEWKRIAPRDLPSRKLPNVESMPDDGAKRRWHFGAWMGDRPVGHVQLWVTSGPQGIAGLYSFGVVSGEENNLDIGSAVLDAACRFARDLGCGYAVLNDEHEHTYGELGFEPVGRGQTWWIQEPEIDTPVPPEAVAFAEAVGRGETEILDRMEPSSLPDDLDRPLACGFTPLEIAARTRQTASGEWLLRHGATPDLGSLWDLGWKERIPGYLSRKPELINRRFGGEKKTPLHEAVWRDDVEFARFLLGHGADPTLEDEGFRSTPLGWAQYLGRPELVRLLESYPR